MRLDFGIDISDILFVEILIYIHNSQSELVLLGIILLFLIPLYYEYLFGKVPTEFIYIWRIQYSNDARVVYAWAW